MPSPKQMEKMAALVGRTVSRGRALAPDDDLPAEYWQALLAKLSVDLTRWRRSAPEADCG
jgi:hypothetical protein